MTDDEAFDAKLFRRTSIPALPHKQLLESKQETLRRFVGRAIFGGIQPVFALSLRAAKDGGIRLVNDLP